MRSLVLLSFALLSACVISDSPRYRTYPQPPPPPPSPTQEQPKTPPPTPAPSFPAPADYVDAVRQIESLQARMASLVEKDRLFEMGSVVKNLVFVVSHAPDLIERHSISRILEQVKASSRALGDAAENLGRPSQGKEVLLAHNAEVLKHLDVLKKFESLSDEYEIKNVPKGLPATYKRAMTRISGVYHSIQEKIQGGQFSEIAEVARHLGQVAEHLPALAVNDIGHPLKHQVQIASDQLRKEAYQASAAAERDDKEAVKRHLQGLSEPVKQLKAAWTE